MENNFNGYPVNVQCFNCFKYEGYVKWASDDTTKFIECPVCGKNMVMTLGNTFKSTDEVVKSLLEDGDDVDYENLIDTLIKEFETDGESYRHKANELLRAYQKKNVDDILIALCGWSLPSIIAKMNAEENNSNEKNDF